MRPIIEFCASNMHHGTDKVMQKLESNPDFDVVEYGCLGNCGECYMTPYALVNGELISASTPEELYDNIIRAVQDQEDPLAGLLLDDEEEDEGENQ